jgi:hypothetical protein
MLQHRPQPLNLDGKQTMRPLRKTVGDHSRQFDWRNTRARRAPVRLEFMIYAEKPNQSGVQSKVDYEALCDGLRPTWDLRDNRLHGKVECLDGEGGPHGKADQGLF